MLLESVNLIRFILALSPIIVVLVLMVGCKWGGAKAGPVGWLVALTISMLFFGADPMVLAYSQARGVLLTLYVLYIIWLALILFNVVQEAGAISVIGQGIVKLTSDRTLQLLILSWVFSSFLQGIAGYGVPIAVVAPLLIGLGFPPITAVASVSAGHAWSVTFGSIAASFNAMVAASGMPGELLVSWSAILLGAVCFLSGIAAAYDFEGWKSIWHGLPAILIIGLAMALSQYLVATRGLWNVAAFVAGLVGLGVSVLVSRLTRFRQSTTEISLPSAATTNPGRGVSMPILLAVVAYVILVVVVSAAELVPAVHELLNTIKLELVFPATETKLGWVTKAGKGQSISIFGHAGALLAYSSLFAYLVYSFTGHFNRDSLKRIVSNTVQSGLRSSVGIASMVGFALIMDQSGMTNLIAVGLSRSIKEIFPWVSPFIGLLGAFMTGSNTNSNVVFVGLQKQTAELLGLPVAIILAAQTTGGAIGGMLAPARIIVGCSTANLAGEEGQVLRRTIPYGIVITTIVGAIVWLAVSVKE
jgi:lactate permease